MNFNTVDLQKELVKNKNSREDLLEEVNQLFANEENKEAEILKRIEGDPNFNWQLVEQLDAENIYTLDQIRSICVKYRLRFLDSNYFKGEIPFEAVSKIKELEKELGKPLNGFKIVAPKELFRLEDKDSDPLLFLQLTENQFYFIHKWGGELNKFRSTLAFPLRSFMNMFWFLAGVALVFSLLIPTASFDVFAFLFVHSFLAICGMTCMLVFTSRQNFSDVEWDSRFFS